MDFNNTGAMRSPFSPRMRQSISGRRTAGMSSGKNQSKLSESQDEQVGEVIYKTPTITLETYGPPLPVMVTEALTFASSEVTVRLSACGWCWAVTGRRVLAWAGAGGAARELTLPQTDLKHKADLVVIFYEDDAQLPSCIGVSPEGVVRYWASVGQESVYCDVSCELAGQECERLAERPLVLATTTCTLVTLTPTVQDGRTTVTCKTLRPPSGWLGGIGRRVSLLFFGSMPVHADTKLVGVVAGREYIGLVAQGGAGPVLQLWAAGLHEHELRRLLLDALPRHYHGDANGLEIVALDVQANGEEELVLLIGIANVARSPEMRHAIALVDISAPAAPRVTSVRGVACGGGARLLGAGAALWPGGVACAEGERADAAPGDALLAGGAGAVFSLKHGVLRVRGAGGARAAPPPPALYDGNLSLYALDPRALRPPPSDAAMCLKTGFLFHVRREAAAAARALAPLRAAAAVDATVLRVAAQLLDDAPAGDPRWPPPPGPATDISLGRSTALQISAQLQDKKRAFTLFLDFLRAHKLWQQLQKVTFEGTEMNTSDALCVLAERLAAAAALRARHVSGEEALLEGAVQRAARDLQPDEEPAVAAAARAGALGPADVCYRRVTRAELILSRLASASVPAALLPRQLAAVAGVAREMARVRAAWPGAARRAPAAALLELHARALPAAAAAPPPERAALLEAAADLADTLLALAPIELRKDLILPYAKEGQLERALALADKYGEFGLLLRLCLEAGDAERLCDYVDKYIDEGSVESTLEVVWSAKGAVGTGVVRALARRRALLARARRWAGAAAERAPLAALLALAAGDQRAAAAALGAAAADETASVARLATVASLGKLWAVASGAEAERGALEARLALAERHAALPAHLQPARLLSPEQLVERYVSHEGGALSEYDYKQALELCEAAGERRAELRLRVWAAALLADDWRPALAAAAPPDLMSHTFFRLIDLVHLMGGDLELLLPPLDELLSAPELAALAADPKFHYTIKYGYECLDTNRDVALAAE